MLLIIQGNASENTGMCLLYRVPEQSSFQDLSWKMLADCAIKLSSSVTRYNKHSDLGYDIQNFWSQRAETSG